MVKRSGLLTIVLLAFPAGAAAADRNTAACQHIFRTVPAGNAIALSGVIGESSGFVQTLHVISVKSPALRVSHGGLQGPATVDQSLVAATVSPAPKGARSVAVSVTGIVEPGDYRGRVTLARGRFRCTLALNVTARERPQLAPLGGDAIDLGLTSCWKICPGPAKVAVTLSDPGRALVSAHNVRLKLYRHKDGDRLNGVTAAADVQISGRDAGTLILSIDQHELHPGHYDGVALLDVEGERSPLAVPAKADVKAGRTVPLIVIGFAFLVRLLAGYLRRRSSAQTVLRALHGARDSISALTDKEKAALLGHFNEAVRRWRAGDAAGAGSLLSAIESWRALLLEARGLRARVPDQRVQTLKAAIAALRLSVAGGSQAEIDAAMAKVREAAFNARPRGTADAAILNPAQGKVNVPPVTQPSWLDRRVAATVAFAERVVRLDNLAVRLLENVIEVAIVLALVFVVLQEAYFSNDTFGADWLKDYGALFVTALGATAVGRLVVGVISRSALLGGEP